MLTLIQNGEIYAPEPQGRGDVLLVGDRVARVGAIDRRAVEAPGLELAVIDATDCLVTPGIIDPHEHLTGGSGEQGFNTQTPEIFLGELISDGRACDETTRKRRRAAGLGDRRGEPARRGAEGQRLFDGRGIENNE